MEFYARMKSHFVEACAHIIKKSPLKLKPLLRNSCCLQPKERTSQHSCQDVVTLGKALPISLDTSILLDEWKLLQHEKENFTSGSIDNYWAQFFVLKNSMGDVKYPNVAILVEAVLSLSHGNADLERGFCVSSNFLTQDKASMSERTLNAAMTVKNTIKMFHMQPDLHWLMLHTPATMLTYNSKAHKGRNCTEESGIGGEKIEAENRKLKLKGGKGTHNEPFEEANKILKKAVEKKDMGEIGLAQAMLEGVNKIKKETSENRAEVDHVQHSVDQKKSKIISDNFSKLSK
ncbi:hypothetical protein PR048_015606 [Dryococelus australis]|uniref:HAT C-terminal dimerisation domain-containing protein n=1 Tax=Dryococelus australis TaxID=614101 RepID=A0ABQ9HHC8_9NEOP|nr:hypothetical protein PR048_015606 [Dryococelus australis]